MARPTITGVDASNEVPQGHRLTLLSVQGTGFTLCQTATVTIHAGTSLTGRVIAHATTPVDTSGNIYWSGSCTPQIGCDMPVCAIAHDNISGESTKEVIANVVCV